MRIGRGTLGCLIAGLLVCIGAVACDDQSEVPADLIQQADAPSDPPPAATRPTTQELVEGSRVPMALDMLPLVMQVPPSWKITRHSSPSGSIAWLEGPTPAGEARIHLKLQNAMTPRQWDQLVMGTQREIQRADDPNTKLETRKLGAADLIERRTVGTPISAPLVDATGMPTLDAKGDVVMHTMTPMRWRVSIYLPREGQVEHYELNFIDLEKPQYEKDREFLEGILKTLRYTGTGPVTDPTPAAAPATAPALPR